VVSLALLTKQTAPAASAPTAGVTPRPTPTQAPRSPGGRPTAPTFAQTSGAPSRNPTATPDPPFLAIPAAPGPTELSPGGSTSVRLTIRLLDGWSKIGHTRYARSVGRAPALASIGAWRIQHVHVFPCRWAAAVLADDQLMWTAAGQAQALSAWWGQDPGMPPDSNAPIAPVSTTPRPTTLVGYAAWYVEILIPSDFDLSECDGGQLILWDTANGPVRTALGPGELIRVWVVDVDGEPIVIEGSTFLGTSPADAAELQAVIDSIVIEPGQG
jgi:hypothetical protein